MSPTRRNCLAGMAALCLGTCLATPGTARAVTIHDDQGELTIDTPPARIVALEYSFVDALANVGISPVGIADDGQPDRIQEPMRSLIKPWTSVGTRSQPSMEVIAGLKPDLIIADTSRHRAVYDQLRKIAPVLLLSSRYGTYTELLAQAQTIADAVGRSQPMKERISQLQTEMKAIAKIVPQGQSAMFGTSRENALNVHSQASFAGSLLMELGFRVAPPQNGKEIYDISLESLLAMNPDWMFIAHYRQESVLRKWEKQPLWQALAAPRKQQVTAVDSQLWARSRSIAEARPDRRPRHDIRLRPAPWAWSTMDPRAGLARHATGMPLRRIIVILATHTEHHRQSATVMPVVPDGRHMTTPPFLFCPTFHGAGHHRKTTRCPSIDANT